MQMKNKILASLTALCAALVLVGGFSVTAFAQTPEGEDATDPDGGNRRQRRNRGNRTAAPYPGGQHDPCGRHRRGRCRG